MLPLPLPLLLPAAPPPLFPRTRSSSAHPPPFLSPCYPLPPARSGEEIKRAQAGTSVFLRGPEDSPALKERAAQPRPVASYTLDKPAAASAYAAPRGQQHVATSFSFSDMAPRGSVTHGAPITVRGGAGSAAAEAEAAATREAAASAARGAHAKRLEMLTPQWSIGQASS